MSSRYLVANDRFSGLVLTKQNKNKKKKRELDNQIYNQKPKTSFQSILRIDKIIFKMN